MIALFRNWLKPASASKRIFIAGPVLQAEGTGPVRRSMYISRMKVYVPDCRSYVVEYRLAEGGEFAVVRQERGRVVLRSCILPGYTIPACWLSPRLVGRRVNRYIVRVDERRVHVRAGLRDNSRIFAMRHQVPKGRRAAARPRISAAS